MIQHTIVCSEQQPKYIGGGSSFWSSVNSTFNMGFSTTKSQSGNHYLQEKVKKQGLLSNLLDKARNKRAPSMAKKTSLNPKARRPSFSESGN
jgi:hypothetical protein